MFKIIKLGLSNMSNIAHVKTTNSNNFFLENNNYIFNIKRASFNTKLLF